MTFCVVEEKIVPAVSAFQKHSEMGPTQHGGDGSCLGRSPEGQPSSETETRGLRRAWLSPFLQMTIKQHKHLPYLFSLPLHRRGKSVCFPSRPSRHRPAPTCTSNKGKEEKTRTRHRAPHPFVASLFTENNSTGTGNSGTYLAVPVPAPTSRYWNH